MTKILSKILSKIKNLFHRHKYEETTIPRIVSGIECGADGARIFYKESYTELVKICKCGKKITQRIK